MICPFCKVPANYVFTINRFLPPFDIYKCIFCNLYIKKQTHKEAYYTKEYYQGNAPYSYIDERKFEVYFRQVWNARIKNIKKYKPSPAKVLDVGCSFGGFVKVFLENGYDAEGIDISKYATREAQRDPILKNRIFYSDILNFPISKKYDIITLIEVIEHLNNPDQIFDKIAKLLNPDGLLILQTANFDGLQAILQGKRYHYFLPGHLYYYSKSNLISILKKYDFKKFISYHGVDFGLIPKLKKAKGMMKNQLTLMKIIGYHFLSKIYLGNFSLTSSYVLYAFKK